MLSNDICLTTYPEIRPSSLSLRPFWRCFSLYLGREGESRKKTAWKVTFSHESACDDYWEKHSSAQLNLIVTPSSFEIWVKICGFWLTDTAGYCMLLPSSACHTWPSAFVSQDLKNISCWLRTARWTDTNTAAERAGGHPFALTPSQSNFLSPPQDGVLQYSRVVDGQQCMESAPLLWGFHTLNPLL